jgi:hypothetical protein
MTVVAPLARWIATPRNTFFWGWDKSLPVEPAGAGVELRALNGLRQSGRAADAIDTRVWAMAGRRAASSSNAGMDAVQSSRIGKEYRHAGVHTGAKMASCRRQDGAGRARCRRLE